MEAASIVADSKASSSAGTKIPRMPAMPRVGRPRKRRASWSRRTDAISSGVKHSATVTATATSWNTPGIERRRSRGLARAFAAPKANKITASFNPPCSAVKSASVVTGPPRDTPANHDGKVTEGMVKRVWPGLRWPKSTWITIRTVTTNTAIFTKPKMVVLAT